MTVAMLSQRWMFKNGKYKKLIYICIYIYIYIYNLTIYTPDGGACGVMVIVTYMDTAIRVQFLDKTDCISYSTNTLGKGMNPIILPPAMVNSRAD